MTLQIYVLLTQASNRSTVGYSPDAATLRGHLSSLSHTHPHTGTSLNHTDTRAYQTCAHAETYVGTHIHKGMCTPQMACVYVHISAHTHTTLTHVHIHTYEHIYTGPQATETQIRTFTLDTQILTHTSTQRGTRALITHRYMLTLIYAHITQDIS